ncbi:MAG: hypothetical protein V2I46_09665 [Bacteroides sp.]|jgi:hypothetical protein|nr:hypothetical protein [Bacteroides sp.]
MKTLRLLFVLTLACTLSAAHAQKVKTYKAWVTLMDKTEVKGTCYAANEDEFVILGEDLNQIGFAPESMAAIKFRRQGNTGKGAWMGAIAGATIGVVIGLASTQDAYISQGGGALIGGLIGAPVGALAGAGLNSGREKFLVNGDQATYLALLPRLRQYAPKNGL